jgi:hypothetical protein
MYQIRNGIAGGWILFQARKGVVCKDAAHYTQNKMAGYFFIRTLPSLKALPALSPSSQ